MSNYSNFDLRKFLAEGKKADKESMEEQEQVALTGNLQEEPVSIAAVAAGVAAIFGGSIGLTKLIDKAEAGDFGEKGEKLAKHLRDMGAAAGQAIHGDGDHHPFEGAEVEEELEVEEKLNEDPVSIPFVAAGLAAIFGGSIGLDKLMDKAEAGDFGPKGEKLAAHLRKYGKQAGDATQHRGFEEGAESEEIDESVIAGVAALIGSSLAAAKVLDWIKKNYPEATEKFVKAAEAGMRGAGHGGTEKGGMMFEKEDEEKKDKMDEAKFKQEIKSILES